MGLLDSVKGVMTNAVIDKAAGVLGIENDMMKSAMKMFLPAVIGGVISKGDTEEKAGGLIDLFKKGGFGDGNLSDLMGVLGSPDKRDDFLSTGSDLLGTIFGNSKSGLLDSLINATGIKKGVGSTLLKMLAPIVINKLAGIVFSKNMSASGLSSYLNDQKSEINGLIPGMATMLGESQASDGKVNTTAATASLGQEDDEASSSGWMKWLLPILLGAGLLYLLGTKGCGATEVDSSKDDDAVTETVEPKTNKSKETTAVTNTENETTSGSSVEALDIDVNTIKVNDNGDVVNESGSVILTAGSYDVDGSGNVLDSNGRIIIPEANLTPSLKNRFQELLDMIRKSRMMTMFGDMLGKKTGAKTTYALSNIEFNNENHKIKNYSKAEVEGLAAALKANESGKIEVHVYTDNGKNEKENKSLSETRAKVITDMLTTLGVKANQLKNVGMGSENAAKAEMGKVDIVIK